MPQSQQFEALSHELFEMSSGSLGNFTGVPDFLTLPLPAPPAIAQQPMYQPSYADLSQTLSVPSAVQSSNGQFSTYPQLQDSFGSSSNNVFDFFNVDPNQIGQQSNLQEWAWEGPSLFDMFDIVGPGGTQQGH